MLLSHPHHITAKDDDNVAVDFNPIIIRRSRSAVPSVDGGHHIPIEITPRTNNHLHNRQLDVGSDTSDTTDTGIGRIAMASYRRRG